MSKIVDQNGVVTREPFLGEVVAVVFKDGNIDSKRYEVTKTIGADVWLSRVKKQPGYPNAGHKTIFVTDLNLVHISDKSTEPYVSPADANSSSRILWLRELWFGGSFLNIKTPTDEFQRLVIALEPENLFCDGEVAVSVARRKEKEIKELWRDCEKRFGRKVSTLEVWKSLEDKTELER